MLLTTPRASFPAIAYIFFRIFPPFPWTWLLLLCWLLTLYTPELEGHEHKDKNKAVQKGPASIRKIRRWSIAISIIKGEAAGDGAGVFKDREALTSSSPPHMMLKHSQGEDRSSKSHIYNAKTCMYLCRSGTDLASSKDDPYSSRAVHIVRKICNQIN